MQTLTGFLMENAGQLDNYKVTVSPRFKDENGDPLQFELKVVKSDEERQLRVKARKRTPVAGKKGQYTESFDQDYYMLLLVTSAIVFPDLQDAMLQDNYGVKTPEALLEKMLYPSEMTVLAQAIQENSGYAHDVEEFEEKVDEAKN